MANALDDSRRRFLARFGALSATAWVAPAILTMEPAGADTLTSPPPQRSGGDSRVTEATGRPPTDVPASFKCGVCTEEFDDVNKIREHAHPRSEDPAVAGTLPRTGANVATEAEVAVAAIVGGVVLRYWEAAGE